MEKNEFKKLLFKVAFCSMACDGHIDESEIDEMKTMDKNTSFFHDIDLSEELSELISELGKKGAQAIRKMKVEIRPLKNLKIFVQGSDQNGNKEGHFSWKTSRVPPISLFSNLPSSATSSGPSASWTPTP